MIKKILFFSCAIAITFTQAKAQKADTLRAKATYGFIHIENTDQPDKPYTEQMVLLLGNNASVYVSMDKIRIDEKRKADLQQQLKNATPGNMNINLSTGPGRHIRDEIYQFANEKKLITNKRLINSYLIEEELPQISWNISEDTSTISGLKCQKATTHFKGRDYIAWFCQDLPFQSGPWKLNGLPGLIVEAYDTKKEVIFKFEGFEKVNNLPPVEEKEITLTGFSADAAKLSGLSAGELLSSQTIALPKNAIKATQKEFDKLNESMKKDPSGFINSSMAGSASNILVKTVIAPPSASTKLTINNPIELPETK